MYISSMDYILYGHSFYVIFYIVLVCDNLRVVVGKSISVSGVVVQQSMRFLMGRKR